jgi:uncharacterized membrane protein
MTILILSSKFKAWISYPNQKPSLFMLATFHWSWRRSNKDKSFLLAFFNASFLIMLKLGTVIAHIISIALVKVILYGNCCANLLELLTLLPSCLT